MPRPDRLRPTLILAMLLALGGLLGAAPSSAPGLYQEGVRLLDQENPYEAIVAFKEALAINPAYLDPLLMLAETYYYLDEYDEALRWIGRAMPLGKENARLLNIHGRILLALGKTDEAAAIFRSIQKREPYNVDALLGLAEFSLARGDEISALKQFQKSLEYDRKDRRILLSLAIMNESKGNRSQAENFLMQALDAWPESPLVQTMAAEYYLRNKRFDDAEFHGTTALSLQPKFRRAMMALARSRLFSGKSSEALAILEQVRELDDRYAMARYYEAMALVAMAQDAATLHKVCLALEETLRLDNADEVSRIVLENVAKRLETAVAALPEDSAEAKYAKELLTRLGSYHYQQASQYRKKNLFARADFHYLRARKLDPLNLGGRRDYAEFLKARGLQARFVEELQVLSEKLKASGKTDRWVNDNLGIFTSLRRQSVANSWKIDQFDTRKAGQAEREPLIFRIFYQTGSQRIDHPRSEAWLAAYFQDLLACEKITFAIPHPRRPLPIEQATWTDADRESAGVLPLPLVSASDAFRLAREERVDYYVLVSFDESGDDFRVKADLYLARTGNPVRSYAAYRTGNFRAQNAMYQVVEALQQETPLRGKLINRKLNVGLVNVGAADGIKVGDVLQLVAPDGYVLQGDKPGFGYSTDRVTGTFTVTRLDDLVAEGTIQREGFYDRINLGDVILRDGESAIRPKDATANFPYLYNQIRGIR